MAEGPPSVEAFDQMLRRWLCRPSVGSFESQPLVS